MELIPMILIMLGSGLLGGGINYLLPANQNNETKEKVYSPRQCILLGIGATLLVPLFLELASSQLLQDIRLGDEPRVSSANDSVVVRERVDTMRLTLVVRTDTGSSRPVKIDTLFTKGKIISRSTNPSTTQNHSSGKNYLLWAAYCVVAASAGFRFIDMIIKKVVTEEELKNAKDTAAALKEKNQLEQQQQRLDSAREEAKVTGEVFKTSSMGKSAQTNMSLPVLLPPTDPDDPQKNRFGGSPSANGRILKATVSSSNFPDFYRVHFTVESLDPTNNPFTGKVIFYLHDSFSPSVYTVDVVNGIAQDEVLSYGAFTIGVICDEGNTRLELDLSQNPDYPKRFREL